MAGCLQCSSVCAPQRVPCAECGRLFSRKSNRGHRCFYKNETALLVTFPYKSLSSRAQSPSFGGSARVRLGIKEEGTVSASSDQDHSIQHPKDNW